MPLRLSLRAKRGNLGIMTKQYSVYLLTNQTNTVFYVGVTSDLIARTYQHKNDLIEGFTKKYQVHKLVYFEMFNDVTEAISREKQIKAGSRQKKNDLVKTMNPQWLDLYPDLVGKIATPARAVSQ